MHALVAEYYEQWMAPDGQGKLEPSDERGGFAPDSPKITRNENGQLFITQFYYLADKLDSLPENADEEFKRVYELSKVPGYHGLTYRRFMDAGIRQSHDNITALVAGSVLFGDGIRFEIAWWGVTHGWCFNAQNPNEWDIRTCLQGGDIAFIKIACGWVPTLWEMFWFMAGRIIVPHDAGKVNLSQLRFWAIEKSFKKYSYPTWVKFMHDISSFIFGLRHNINGSTHWAIEKYFYRENLVRQNPVIEMSKLINTKP